MVTKRREVANGFRAAADAGSARKRAGHIRVGNRWIGPDEPCYIIAEVGLNHNGDLTLAKRLVDAAVEACADAVKFQKRKLSEVYQQAILDHPRAGEQGLQYIVPLLIEFELSDEEFRELSDYCGKRRITFLCTPWDRASVAFLEGLGVPAYKIGSPDMTNFPLIEYVAATGKPLLVSTGMSSEDEIRRTLAFLAERRVEFGVFHCVSTYPVAAEDVNLRFMQELREWCGSPVGYSGHDSGTAISLAAVAMGACMLERHITLDRTMRGPDHLASLEPAGFAELVRGVREVEAGLGVAHRWMTRGELLNRRVLAKSLVAAVALPSGTVITRDMVTSKSPGLGLSPQVIDQLIGRRLERSLRRDEAFVEADLRDGVGRRTLAPIDLGIPWGIIARFTDVEGLLRHFADGGMTLLEFHVSDRDLDAGMAAFRPARYPFDLVVHAPEYRHDRLIDLCTADAEQRRSSIKRIQDTIDLARQLAPWFEGVSRPGPKVVVHVGGMSPDSGAYYDAQAACGRLLDSLRQLDTAGVDLLLENLPPFPWYFGGRWFGHVLTDAATTAKMCTASGLGLCFDTSHAALECHRNGTNLMDFARHVLQHVRHLHLSDAAGVSGEGLQIGEGQINFVELMPVLAQAGAGCVPEVWMGHHDEGAGFQTALERLSESVWAARALARAVKPAVLAQLEGLVVRASATVRVTLQTIDANKLGIAFVVNGQGVLEGVVTDGDIRRGLMRGKNLELPITEVMTRDYAFAPDSMSSEDVRARLSTRIRVIPILDAAHRLVDFASIYEPNRDEEVGSE